MQTVSLYFVFDYIRGVTYNMWKTMFSCFVKYTHTHTHTHIYILHEFYNCVDNTLYSSPVDNIWKRLFVNIFNLFI